MRVLISGGGRAGLTLAYWLRRGGVEPVFVEQADSPRRDGYAIDFFGAGYDVAGRMGLIEHLTGQRIQLDAISYVDSRGRDVARVDKALLDRVATGTYLALTHATLEEALLNALGGQVEVRFGRTLVTARSGDSSVEPTFSDGASESFDLLIGANGVHSRTRELVFAPEVRYRRFLGYMVARFPLRDRYGVGRRWLMYNEPGRMLGVYPGPRDGSLYAFMMYEVPDPERVGPERRLARLREAFTGMGWITRAAPADVAPDERIFLDDVSQIEMAAWSRLSGGRRLRLPDADLWPGRVAGAGRRVYAGARAARGSGLARRTPIGPPAAAHSPQTQEATFSGSELSAPWYWEHSGSAPRMVGP